MGVELFHTELVPQKCIQILIRNYKLGSLLYTLVFIYKDCDPKQIIDFINLITPFSQCVYTVMSWPDLV
jgi:hypothetical protein